MARLELVPGLVRIGAQAPGELEQQLAAALVPRLGPRVDGALGEAEVGVADDQRLVVLQHRAEAVAVGTGAAGVIEGKERRRHHGGGSVACAAGRRAGEAESAAVVQGERDAFTLLERGRDRLGEAPQRCRPGGQAVHHYEQLRGPGQVQAGRQLVQMVWCPVRHHPDEAERTQVLDHGGMLEPGDRRQRKGDLDPAAHRRDDVVGRGLGSVPPDGAAARPAPAPPDPGPEEPQVVVHLGRRADRRATRDGRVPLLDRDRGSDPLQPVDLRLRHPLQELLGVGRKRLDVPALPLRVEGIEREAALARAGGTGDDRERAVGQLDGDALQVMLASVDDADDGIGHGRRIAG